MAFTKDRGEDPGKKEKRGERWRESEGEEQSVRNTSKTPGTEILVSGY